MKKREIFLVFALILFGVIYQAVEKGKVRFASDFSFYSDARKLKGSRFAEFPEPEKLFANVRKVTIDNPAGEIIINRSDDGQVHLAHFLRVYYADRSDVETLRQRVRVTADFNDGELKIALHYSSPFPYRRLRAHFHLRVPEDTILALSNQEGDVIIKDAGKELNISQESGKLFLENIRSRIDLRLRKCNARLKGIADHVEIDISHGSISVESAVSLRLAGRHGDCTVKNIEKDVVIEHAFGKLVLDGAGKVEIKARHSDINARNIRDGVAVSDKYGTMTLEYVGGDMRFSGLSSTIDLNHASAGSIVVENAYADTRIRDFSGKNLDVLVKNGNLDLGVTSIADRINIRSQHAELKLVFAALADPTFNIRTKQGRIFIESPLELESYAEKEERFANRSGQKPEIFINNTYGDIRVKTTK